jgi:hypothetical protein
MSEKRMNLHGVIDEHREDIALAMQGLCDALGRLSSVRDNIIEDLKTQPPGHPNERLALGFHRACVSLTSAAAEIPGECFAIMLRAHDVGVEEIQRRVDMMLSNTVISNGLVGKAVPA